MKFFDWFRKSREERIRKQAEERREERLAEELKEKMDEHEAWLAEVKNRYFNKSDLVWFVQFGHDKNDNNRYFMCGYLNTDGNRFRDLGTGDIYDVFDAPYPDGDSKEKESFRPTILVGDSSFVKIEPVVYNYDDYKHTRGIDIGLSGTALTSTTAWSPFGDHGIVLKDNGSTRGIYTMAPKLYQLCDKKSKDLVVSGSDVLKAVGQVNMHCAENVRIEQERRKNLSMRKNALDLNDAQREQMAEDAKLTPEELDF